MVFQDEKLAVQTVFFLQENFKILLGKRLSPDYKSDVKNSGRGSIVGNFPFNAAYNFIALHF